MESDAVRTIGDNTVVDMWVSGQFRNVSVPREAIAAFLHLSPERAAEMSDPDLRDFVRSHLRIVAVAAAEGLKEMYPNATSVTIDPELLLQHAGEPLAEQRRAAGR
jgi:hypothetical protein